MPDTQCQKCNRRSFDEGWLNHGAMGQYFNLLMNKENQRDGTEERYPNQAMALNISEEETETPHKGMKCGKAVGAD